VSEDISLNGRLFVSGDASLNGKLYTSGYVGIGSTTPTVALDVSGAGKFTGSITRSSIADINNVLTNQWHLLGRYSSIVDGAGFILEVAGSSGYDLANNDLTSQCYGTTLICGRILNNSPTGDANTSKANLSLTYNFQGGNKNVLSVIGVQVGTDRNKYDIYAQIAGASSAVLNVNTVSSGSVFDVNSSLTTSVTAPSTSASVTVSVGKYITPISGRPDFTQSYSNVIGLGKLSTVGDTANIYTFPTTGVYLIWITDGKNATDDYGDTTVNSGDSATTDNYVWLGYAVNSYSSYNVAFSKLFGTQAYLYPISGSNYNSMKVKVTQGIDPRYFYLWIQKIF
jgi:hypothetical protein